MKFYELVKTDVEATEKHIEKSLKSESKNSYMYDLILEYIMRGGKRLRPALLFLCTGALGGKKEEAVRTAAVIEMFHCFSLVHDDIEDDSLLRRGKPTMHIDQGIPIAINTGDALYTLVWREMMNVSNSREKMIVLSSLLVECFKKVVEGQALELKWYKDKFIDVREKEYLEMISLKTGALISTSCEAAAIIAGKEKFSKNLQNFGYKIGMAFQIQDDVLNIVGEEEKYKKEIGGDITEGKRTLMLSYALEHLGKPASSELKKIILSHTREKEKLSRAINLFKSSGAIEYASLFALKLIEEAKHEIKVLPDSEYKEALLEVADYMVFRTS